MGLLSNLHIENIAVVESADVEFENGLNVLTGETGAGKSVIIGAIRAVLGNRMPKDSIRHDAEYGLVTAIFTDLTDSNINFIKSLGYECDDRSVLIHREIYLNGKNVCKINGRPATVSMLKSVGKELIDAYGQNDSYSLCNISTHIDYIDSLGNLFLDLDAYQTIYDEMINLRKKIELINKNSKENIAKADMLHYQINELEEANLIPGELEDLNQKREVCINSERIKNAINEVHITLNGDDSSLGAVQGIERTVDLIDNIMCYSKDLEEVYNRMSSIFYELQECAIEIQNVGDKFDYDAFELEEIEKRLDTLYKLRRKYGESTDEMLLYLKKAKEELSLIEVNDEDMERFSAEYEKLKDNAQKLADKISFKRHEVSMAFMKKVSKELAFLDMPNAEVSVNVERSELRRLGCDQVEIMASLNKGDSLKPIAKIASGGELSRLMLAIKNVISDDNGVGTLIFDEIDTGVSGSAAQKIGLKLRELSVKKQVICITHLAQIACLGDSHFLIKKSINGNSTCTKVKKLSSLERQKEIARIIEGASISEITLKNAEEMLRRAQNLE